MGRGLKLDMSGPERALKKRKKKINSVNNCPWFFALIFSMLNQQVLEQMGGVNQ